MADAKNRCLRHAWLLAVLGACATGTPQTRFDFQAVGANSVWLPAVRNSTDADLRLPATNPLRSLAEMAGKISPGERATVMTLLREQLRRELEQKKLRARFPEEQDPRFSVLPLRYFSWARISR
jgi:hypothetical protein